MIVGGGKAEGRRQRDEAFKDATQVRVTAPPEGSRIKNFFIQNLEFRNKIFMNSLPSKGAVF